MKSWPKIKRLPVRSSYHRLKGCDCPECIPSSPTGKVIDWLESPAGPWSTALVIVVAVALAAAWYWWRPLLTPVTTAITG